jgi:hypothetical protein
MNSPNAVDLQDLDDSQLIDFIEIAHDSAMGATEQSDKDFYSKEFYKGTCALHNRLRELRDDIESVIYQVHDNYN